MEKEIVSFYKRNRTLVAALSCEIDHHSVGRLRQRIDRELFLEKPDMLALDFSQVRFMDSSGIALILGRVETAEAVGATVRLEGLSPSLQRLLRISGLERIKSLSISNRE